jgi:hypothetical protein
MDTAQMSALAGIIFLIIGLFLYFLPAIIAVDRKLLNTGSIFIVNLFLGWTLVGWVGALAWALAGTANTKSISTGDA